MCSMLKQEMDTRKIPYEMVQDSSTMKTKGITHVPVLELPSGQMMLAAAALEYIKGGTADVR